MYQASANIKRYHLHRFCTLHVPLYCGFCNVELLFHFCTIHIPVSPYRFLLCERNSDNDSAVTRYSIMQFSGIEFCHTNGHLLLLQVYKAAQQLYGVSTLLVYVVATMAACQALHTNLHEEPALRLVGIFSLKVKDSCRRLSSCTRDIEQSLVL